MEVLIWHNVTKSLQQHLEDVKWRLKTHMNRPCRSPQSGLKKAAAEYGFFTDEVFQRRGGKRVKLRKLPRNTPTRRSSQTWTGKGRQPNWFRNLFPNAQQPEIPGNCKLNLDIAPLAMITLPRGASLWLWK